MFDIGLQEMLVIGVLALLVFGPGKLPELGRKVGRLVREFRRASDEFRSTVESNLKLNEPDPPAPAPAEPSVAVTPESVPTSELPSEKEPEGSETDAAVAVAVEHEEPFCAQRGSRIFHRRECGWVKRIPEAERQYFKHLADARDQGFANCPVCDPWEPM